MTLFPAHQLVPCKGIFGALVERKKERKKEIRPEAWVQETLPEARGMVPL